MSQLYEVPAGTVHLPIILRENRGLEALVDADRPSIEIWSREADGRFVLWFLVGVGEHTVTLMNPRNPHDRCLRRHQGVWLRPGTLNFRDLGQRGQRRYSRTSWTLAQGERGRQNALLNRLLAEAAADQ